MLALALLAACTHSRVVRRDYDDQRAPSTSHRGSRAPAESRAATSPIPAGAIHVVRAGETLYGISFHYGLRYQDVAVWNGIADPYVIEIGQRLRLRPSSQPASPSVLRPNPPGHILQSEYQADGQDVWVTVTVKDKTGKIIDQKTYYSHYARMIGVIMKGVA